MRRILVPPLARLPHRPAGVRTHELGGATMGTTWRVQVAAAPALKRPQIEVVVAEELDAVIAEMSTWEPASALSRFNAAPAGAMHDLPERFAAVMACALDIAAETDGAFDPAIGALVDLWGFGPKGAGPAPDADAVRAAHAAGGWRNIAFQESRLTQPGGLRLDLSGIAKGYAVDRVAARLAATGAQAALVEIGGELTGSGVKPDGLPWWASLEEIDDGPSPIVIALCGNSVATSGDYRRCRNVNGARISHTIDPRTGRPANNAVASVSVVHASCMRADAYATALAVLGADAGLALAARLGLAARMVVRGSERIEEFLSPAFASMLE